MPKLIVLVSLEADDDDGAKMLFVIWTTSNSSKTKAYWLGTHMIRQLLHINHWKVLNQPRAEDIMFTPYKRVQT